MDECVIGRAFPEAPGRLPRRRTPEEPGSSTSPSRGAPGTEASTAFIELIDGHRLADLLTEYSLGVSTHMVEEVQVHEDFFNEIELVAAGAVGAPPG